MGWEVAYGKSDACVKYLELDIRTWNGKEMKHFVNKHEDGEEESARRLETCLRRRPSRTHTILREQLCDAQLEQDGWLSCRLKSFVEENYKAEETWKPA